MSATKVDEIAVRIVQEDAYRFAVTFDEKGFPPLVMDEPAPIGGDTGPDAVRVLAGTIGNCMAASLLFCLGKHGTKLERGLEARVSMELVRNAEGRLRIGRARVTLLLPPELRAEALEACSSVFERFCTVTASIREGIPIEVALEPTPVVGHRDAA